MPPLNSSTLRWVKEVGISERRRAYKGQNACDMVPQPGSDKGESQGTKGSAMRVRLDRAEGPLLSKPGPAPLRVVPGAGNWGILPPGDVRALLERAEAP